MPKLEKTAQTQTPILGPCHHAVTKSYGTRKKRQNFENLPPAPEAGPWPGMLKCFRVQGLAFRAPCGLQSIITPHTVMENQMDKKMENDMEAGGLLGSIFPM